MWRRKRKYCFDTCCTEYRVTYRFTGISLIPRNNVFITITPFRMPISETVRKWHQSFSVHYVWSYILFGSKTYWLSGEPTRDKPAYNFPRSKHSFLKSTSTSENVCPRDLFIVRASETFVGNRERLKDAGKSVGIVGYQLCAPVVRPVRIVAAIKLSRDK